MDQEVSTVLTTGAAALARHALTSLGGSLVTLGVINESGITDFVGAGMLVAGVAWSWWQKSGQAAVLGELTRLRARLTAIQQSNRPTRT